jgi:glycosyltransferase involved in cell wall biosynthesis
MAEWLRRDIGHARVTAVTNGANTKLFKPSGKQAAERFVVFFGGLTIWHGIETMIDAVRHPDWPPGVLLHIIGTGLRRPEVEAAVSAGLPVRYRGPQAYEDIPGLIAGASAGLVPITNPQNRSATGVLPLKLYEVAASGLPVIATDLPGQADFVRQYHCGIVIPPGDAAALAGAVKEIAADPERSREMGRRGAEAVQAEHSWDARGGEVDAALRAMLAERDRLLRLI